jgi:hypothetical protein
VCLPVLCLAVLWLALLCLSASGCKGSESDDGQAESMPPAISESERVRGMEACQAYVQEVCACAKAKPEVGALGEACELAPAKISSLTLVLQLNRAPADADERAGTGNTARRIIGSCISAQADLYSQGCPRPSAP